MPRADHRVKAAWLVLLSVYGLCLSLGLSFSVMATSKVWQLYPTTTIFMALVACMLATVAFRRALQELSPRFRAMPATLQASDALQFLRLGFGLALAPVTSLINVKLVQLGPDAFNRQGYTDAAFVGSFIVLALYMFETTQLRNRGVTFYIHHFLTLCYSLFVWEWYQPQSVSIGTRPPADPGALILGSIGAIDFMVWIPFVLTHLQVQRESEDVDLQKENDAKEHLFLSIYTSEAKLRKTYQLALFLYVGLGRVFQIAVIATYVGLYWNEGDRATQWLLLVFPPLMILLSMDVVFILYARSIKQSDPSESPGSKLRANNLKESSSCGDGTSSARGLTLSHV